MARRRRWDGRPSRRALTSLTTRTVSGPHRPSASDVFQVVRRSLLDRVAIDHPWNEHYRCAESSHCVAASPLVLFRELGIDGGDSSIRRTSHNRLVPGIRAWIHKCCECPVGHADGPHQVRGLACSHDLFSRFLGGLPARLPTCSNLHKRPPYGQRKSRIIQRLKANGACFILQGGVQALVSARPRMACAMFGCRFG
jgi:hypothetical protein